jgi:hypothetical protein
MTETVDHVRIWQNHHAAPSKARLIVVLKPDSWAAHAHDLWDEAEAHVYQTARAAELILVPAKTATLRDLSAADYAASFPVEDANSS